MHILTSKALEVEVLDPVADQERFGMRYCTGGYIFQIRDVQRGPLLSGATYPDSFNVFDGQGMPDAFNLNPLRHPKDPGAPALIIGIGLCDLAANTVLEFNRWQVEAEASRVRMTTVQAHETYGLELERVVSVMDRAVRSEIRLANTGRAPIPLRWFPHPFFPQPETDELCWLNAPVRIGADDPAYEVGASGFIRRKGWPWTEGKYLPLDHAARANLVVLQRHPVVGMVAGICSYAPASFPIWGNPRTFSWEPFLEHTVGAKQTLSWHIDYHF
ncbi:MAG: hypothetical protein ABIL09_05510 [Gemmatimonadota bacterium]